MAAAKKRVVFQRAESRDVGIGFALQSEETRNRKIAEWVDDDHAKLLLLCDVYGIPDGPLRYYKLSLELARELYPEPKKRGRKSKWTELTMGLLVVEVERLVRPDDASHGVEWACDQLAKREPWRSFLEMKESSATTPDPPEALRKVYYGFRSSELADAMRHLSKSRGHDGSIGGWEVAVSHLMRNRGTK